LACFILLLGEKQGESMSTITRSISIDFSTARDLREKAARFREAAEAETRPDVAARFYKQVAFLESQAEFYEGRGRRWLGKYTAPHIADFRDLVTAHMTEEI
jgi:hypothetical protein